MGAKNTDGGHAAGQSGVAVAVDDPAKVRNVVLVGPSGSGKTTLTEALLAATGVLRRAGSVIEGTTVCDHDPAAVRQQRSVGLAVAPMMHDGIKINLIDTPGTPTSSVNCARACAPPTPRCSWCAPPKASTRRRSRCGRSARRSACRAPWSSRGSTTARRLDGEIAACQAAFGAGVLPLYLPARTAPPA